VGKQLVWELAQRNIKEVHDKHHREAQQHLEKVCMCVWFVCLPVCMWVGGCTYLSLFDLTVVCCKAIATTPPSPTDRASEHPTRHTRHTHNQPYQPKPN
jgi:hypothetical protein